MPGLSQLKQFNKDLLSLGDEITIRASRGEKPVAVVIPKEVEDVNDSEEFVLGMPEIEAEIEAAPIDEDLSDLAGLASPPSSSTEGGDTAPAAFEAPDLSSLLNPINVPDDASAGTDMPDLSMFEEEEVQEEEYVEEEPEEVSIADMGLDALLSGGGFDAPEEEAEPEPEPEPEPLNIDDFQEVDDLDSVLDEVEPVEEAAPVDDGLSDLERDLMASMGVDSLGSEAPAETEKQDESLDALLGNIEFGSEEPEEAAEISEPEPIEDIGDFDEVPEAEDLGEIEDFEEIPDVPEVPEISETDESAETLETFDTPVEDFGLDDMDFGAEPVVEPVEEPVEETAVEAPLEDFDAAPLENFDETPADDFGEEAAPGLEDFNLDGLSDLGGDAGSDFGDIDDVGDIGGLEEPAAEGGLDSFGLDDMDFGSDTPAEAIEDAPLDEATLEDAVTPGLDDFDAAPAESFDEEPAAEGGLDSFSLDDMDFGSDTPAESIEEAPLDESATPGLDDFNLEGLSDLGTDLGDDAGSDLGGLEEPAADDFDTAPAESFDEEPAAEGGLDSFSLDDMDFGSSDSDDSVSFDAEDEIPDYEDSSLETDAGVDADSFDSGDENQPLEVFDTSDMEGMDFGIQDTDAQLGGGGDFELGGNDDFAMEGEFEIPGFSDVTTAKEEKSGSGIVSSKDKKGRGKNLPEPDFSGAEESEDLPPNTLSDSQYKQFLKNLGEYPLNVRLAFEDLIVQDEFTDDAEFEVIEKILNKAPARQVASMLEKMLDTSIPVPRDFEHRTAEEYEAYKKSLSYQLKNKIIPGALVCIALMFVAWGIFTFTKNCIYKPLKANKLYKQGYALLQADEYPQSEMKFEQAVTYRINKKWFFNYARGYREHRQYQRAGTMYQRILKYFKHDKAAGLEYADMEVNELANYERAEEIVRREVLDYHINDADGILKLGDIFLEWGTEKDPAKLEDAREQYATLLQLYGSTDLYMSRMMRYFIRTDNLRQVIQMQKTFDARPKALGSEDLAELSGYLLDKYYGTLAPADEYLRYEIEGLRGLLLKAVKADPNNPIALYNLSKYFIKSGETGGIESTLQNAIEKFNTIKSMKKRDIYKYIDSYRLLGEHYIDTTDYLQAQEQFAEGISLYTTERDNAGFEGTPDIGKMYEDMGNIKYIISGDYDEALMNYKYSVELENDNAGIRYRIGYIQYKNKNYVEALGSFMKAGDGNVKERNLLLAMANTLSLRGDDYAAQGYYNQLIDTLDRTIAKQGMVFPQTSVKDYDVVNTYLTAANNYGVTLYKLAKRTGNSALNAQAIVQFQQSVRAWDALTRNQETMVRLGGSNLAEQNIQYITHPIPEFEPSIYTDIAKTLTDNEKL